MLERIRPVPAGACLVTSGPAAASLGPGGWFGAMGWAVRGLCARRCSRVSSRRSSCCSTMGGVADKRGREEGREGVLVWVVSFRGQVVASWRMGSAKSVASTPGIGLYYTAQR